MKKSLAVDNWTDDKHPELEVELGPKGEGVGSWVPEQKHTYLSKYLDASRHAWSKWSSRVLIDPFCGAGRIRVRGETITRDGGAMIAWRQSVAGGAPFTQILVGDLQQARAKACAARLAADGAPVQMFVGPASETVRQMAAVVPRGALCMAYIDPYNLEVLSFDLIEALAELKVDFAVHFSTMDLDRNVDFEFDPERGRFDKTAPGWRDNIDVKKMSKAAARLAFFEYWCELVRKLGFEFSRSMPIVRNDHGHGIYRLVFFARHDLPLRVWGDVAQSKNRDLFD